MSGGVGEGCGRRDGGGAWICRSTEVAGEGEVELVATKLSNRQGGGGEVVVNWWWVWARRGEWWVRGGAGVSGGGPVLCP